MGHDSNHLDNCNTDFDFVSTLPDVIKRFLLLKLWIRFLLITFMFVLSVVIAIYFINNVSNKRIKLLQNQEQMLKTQIINTYQQNMNKGSYNKEDLIQLVKSHVIPKNNIEVFLLHLNQIATDNQIQINSIIPGAVEAVEQSFIIQQTVKQDLMQQSIAITASGQYPHLIDMINKLLASPYLFSIDSLEIIKSDIDSKKHDTQNLAIFLSIRVYMMS
jgi:hypothetical protein